MDTARNVDRYIQFDLDPHETCGPNSMIWTIHFVPIIFKKAILFVKLKNWVCPSFFILPF